MFKFVTLFLTAFSKLLELYSQWKIESSLKAKQELAIKEKADEANNIRANADKLPDDLLLDPKQRSKRSSVCVLDLCPNLRRESTGSGTNSKATDISKDKSS